MCEEYLLTFHKEDLLEILKAAETAKHYSLYINFIVLLEHQPAIVDQLLKKPESCLQNLDDAAVKSQLSLLKEIDTRCQVKSNTHCRIYHLPEFPKMKRFIFPCNSDADKFLQISGIVIRVTATKLLEYQRNYLCVKCKTPVLVQAEYDKNYSIKQPKKCLSCFGSNLVNFGELDNENCKDFQEIKIQEDVKRLGVGSMPDTIWVTLEDDLVDTCKPGDNVTICGVLKRRWSEFDKGKKIIMNLAMKANHVQVDNNTTSSASSSPEIKELFDNYWKKYSENPLEGRDLILKSLCPQLYGLYLVKLAVAVILAGGCQADTSDHTGIRTRSEAHLLLVGDPGTGKSQLLRFASKIVPRSVLTTGIGSTAAGLTVTAMMEHGEWQLEAGALVMADGGICCIDEFNSMKEHDRTSIHEAMEQQSISVAKASIVCKLNTRCSILAACNPKGNFDVLQPLWLSIALPSPLLSRFDLVMLLKDSVNDMWDDKVADYILNDGHSQSKLLNNNIWTIDMLQSYIARIKKFAPKLSEESEIILSAYYQMQRRLDGRNKARTTVRLLESLVRLSQGHARLMYHETVEVIDSIYAIILVDTAMENESSMLSLNVNTNSLFPERPACHYKTIMTSVLEKLQLLEILEKETSSLKENATSGRVESRFFHKHNSSDESKKIEDKLVEEKIINGAQKVDGNEKISRNENGDFQENLNSGRTRNGNTENIISKDNENKNTENIFSRITIDADDDDKQDQDQKVFKAVKNECKTTKGLKDFGTADQNKCENPLDKNKLVQSITEDIPETIGSKDVKSPKENSGNISLKKCNTKHSEAVNSVHDSDNSTNIGRKDNTKSLRKFKFVRRDKDIAEADGHTAKSSVIQSASVSVDNEDISSKKLKPNTSKDCKESDMSLNDKNRTRNSISASYSEVDSSINETNKITIPNNQDRFAERMNIEEQFDSSDIHSKRKHYKDKKPLDRKESNDSVKNDLELLRFMPGVNDDFNIDLDIDWNDYDGATSMFSQKSKASSSSSTLATGNPSRCSLEQFDDDSDLDLEI